MMYRYGFVCLILPVIFLLASCASVSKRMPAELSSMHGYLTEDSPYNCDKYHYNFERKVPRLYREQQPDSILGIIDYIRDQCGPSANLETTRLLLLTEQGHFDDSLIGSATIPQMLWFRSERELLFRWRNMQSLYGWSQPMDNTHDVFENFTADLATQISGDTTTAITGRTLGMFYGGEFDSAFSVIQSDAMRKTSLRKNYDEYVQRIKQQFPERGHLGLTMGSWNPQGNNRILGSHPDIGVQLGVEGIDWRFDCVLNYRFMPAGHRYDVDSMGQMTSTDDFDNWYIGLDLGVKFIDIPAASTDIFFGIGYDVICSVDKDSDPKSDVHLGSMAYSIGLRQRFFLNQRSGWYLGAAVRYTLVDYPNPRGTDLSGNTLSISLVTGWCINETLHQFLDKLNYRGNWRK